MTIGRFAAPTARWETYQPPGVGNRSTPIRPRLRPICGQPVPPPHLPSPIRVHRRPLAVLPLTSTNGAHNPSLGYSPRNWHIKTIQGLKARNDRADPEFAGYIGPSALRFHYYARYPGRWPGLSHYAPLARWETYQPPGAGNRSSPIRNGLPPSADNPFPRPIFPPPFASIRGSPPPQPRRCAQSQPGVQPQVWVRK